MIPYLLAAIGGYLIGESTKSKFLDNAANGSVADAGLEVAAVSVLAKGGLIAPNGKPSNLTPEQYKLVRTPEFKAWFGDWENDSENASKVLDENGEPLIVYRGVPKSLENKYIFDFDTQLLTAYKRVNKFGFYFTSDYELAESYAKNYGYPDKGVIISYFLNIRNLLKIKNKNEIKITQIELLDLLGLKSKFIEENKFTDKQIEDMYSEGSPYLLKRNIHGFFIQFGKINSRFASFLKKNIRKKYDGVLFYEEWRTSNYDNYVCFESNQIKLADGSNTTFDKSNPDIRYNMGGKLIPRYVISVYKDGEYEIYEAESYAEAKRLATQGEHAEIYDTKLKKNIE